MLELNRSFYQDSFSGIASEGFERWKTDTAKVFPPLHIWPTSGSSFTGSIRAAGAEGLYLSRLSSSPHLVERRPDLIARSSQSYLKLSLHLSGQSMLIQDGREAVLQAGDITLYDTSRPYTLVQEQDFSMLVAMFPREAVQTMAPDAQLLTGIKIGADPGMKAIVSDYLRTLDLNLPTLTGPAGQRLSQIGLDLIGSLLAIELDNVPAIEPHTLTLRRILAFIEKNLSDPELSPATIAESHFISVRHLHALFEEAGDTVAARIRKQRLERCRRDLRDPLMLDQTIADIAAHWGFQDAAHFSRLFRTTFNETPSQYRRASKKQR